MKFTVQNIGKIVTESPPTEPKEEFNVQFSLEEMKPTSQHQTVITIVGDKNSGKTTLTYGFEGHKHYLSFDRKSLRPLKSVSITKQLKVNPEEIHVYDMRKYLIIQGDTDEEFLRDWQRGCVLTYKYTCFVLDELKKSGKPCDWVIIDGSEVLSKVCEQTMRYKHDIKPSEGIKNRNLWKERNIYWDTVYQKALNVANRGVIYTTYNQVVNEEVVDGEVVEARKQPAWYGSMKLETDIVLHTFTRFDSKEGIKKYFVITESKDEWLPDGVILDVTNKTIYDALKNHQ